MTTENYQDDDPYLRPYQPDTEDELEEDDEDEDLVADLDEAAGGLSHALLRAGKQPATAGGNGGTGPPT